MAQGKEAKSVFTTHEVSKLLQVNPRSVINWIEQDLLDSYRTPGGHRRIRRQDLKTFLHRHKIPVPPALTEERFKVLIVEDEDPIVTILTKLLDREGIYEVRSSSDGISALIDIGRWHPDLMILDILIPGVDGIEVCRRMKNDVESRTSIIAMSGQPELESTIAKAGADVFMAKPLDLERLLHEAKRLLRVL
jgi:excisionase family DNA binding protein